jgi:hypothetical protein
MRDIKPTGNIHKVPSHNAPGDLPPDAKALYEKHAKKAVPARRFTGSKVDVSSVHVPKQTLPEKKEHPEVTMEHRPLFAAVHPKKKRAKKISMRLGKKERTAVGVLVAIALITGVLAAFIFLPYANISLTLQTAPLLVDQKLTVASNIAASPNAIPGSPFMQDLTVEGSSPVTSTEVVGKKAIGTVQLINKTFDEQKIKERSRLVTKEGTLFYMTGSATIPAASSSGVASVNVQVEAAVAGPQGNIAAQRLDFAALPEGARNQVYGQSQGTFTGGSGEEIKVVKDVDLKQAQTAAGQQAKAQVEQAARAQLQSGWVILEESWDSKITEFTPTAKVGDKVDSIAYKAKVSVRVMAYKEDALTAALQNALKERLDKNYMLFPGPLSYTKSVDAMDWEKGEVTMTARVTHTTIPTLSIETLNEKLAGRSKEEAVTYLQGLPGIQFATIELWPFWVQKVPDIQKRVNIEIKSDREL